MHRRIPLAAVLVALAAILSLPTLAQAVTLHKHYTVQRVRQQRPSAPPILAKVTVMRVVKIAPKDGDQDGIANHKDPCPQDAYSDGGCPPPPAPPAPATTYVSSGAPAPAPTSTVSGDWSSVPGVPASFAACVAMAESTNGTNPAAGGNVYGIIDPVPGTDPVGDPQGAMAALYAQSGTAPWAPYDGC